MKSHMRCSSWAVVWTTLGVFGAGVAVSGNGLAVRGAQAQNVSPTNRCEAPANQIVAENCKTGNPSTEWDINAAGDPTIQGFSTDMSVNVGEPIEFKVKTDSPAYRVDIYRMGYYDGLGARRVATLRPSVPLPQTQPECIADYETRLYDCGNWQVSASWQVPADAVSGVYVARLVREDPPEEPNWRADNSQQTPVPKPLALPHAYGASGLGQLRNAIVEPRASHIVFVVSRRCPGVGRPVSDLGSDLAGVQQIWARQHLQRYYADGREHGAGEPGIQSELQPAAHESADRVREPVLQCRVPHGALARGEWLRRRVLRRGRQPPPG